MTLVINATAQSPFPKDALGREYRDGSTSNDGATPVWNETHVCSREACLAFKLILDICRKTHTCKQFRAPDMEASLRSVLPANATNCPVAMVVAASDSPLPPNNLLQRSASALGVPLAVAHLPLGAQSLRRHVYAHALSSMSACPDMIVLLVDAFDTFLRCSTDKLAQRVRSYGHKAMVVVAAEREYSFQHRFERPKWEALYSNFSGQPSYYRYVNGGGIGGSQHSVLQFMQAAAAESPPAFYGMRPFTGKHGLLGGGSDQNPVARIVMREASAQPSSAFIPRLDYRASLFFTATGKDYYLRYSRVRVNDSDPCIVHVPGKKFRGILATLWNETGPEP